MATTSVQHSKGDRHFGSKGGGALDNGSRLRVKGGREAPGNKKEGINNHGAKGSRGPWKRPAFDGKGGGKVKRPWKPNQDQKVFQGSAREGQGFALWRKNKVQFEYKKLLRKQKKQNTQEASFSDHYPEHLKHLYEAEEEKLKSQEKLRRTKNKPPETGEEKEEVTEDHSNNIEGAPPPLPKKAFKKKTSNQKANEIYRQVQQEREKKREEAENNRRKREEAHKLYLQRRKEAYKVICLKTKKGQPNFNVQMDYLLEKIRSKS